MTDSIVTFFQRARPRDVALIAAGIVALQAAVLFAMGRTPICACGTVKLWHGVVHSSENSQHLFDWYSFTHVLHGFWLYLFGWWLLRRWPVAARLMLAVLLETSWEILENTSFVIERYRAGTIALNYYGDSIVNSVFDAVSMMTGFALARILPVSGAVAAVVVIEFGLFYFIRDNLFLNVLMLMYPIDAVKEWQSRPPI